MKKNLLLVVALTILTIGTLQFLSSNDSRTQIMSYLTNRYLAQDFDEGSEDIIDNTVEQVYTPEPPPKQTTPKEKEAKKKPAAEKKIEKSAEKKKSAAEKKQEIQPKPAAPTAPSTAEIKQQPTTAQQSGGGQNQPEQLQKPVEKTPTPVITVFGLPSRYSSQITETTSLQPEQQFIATPAPPPSFQSFDVDQVKNSPQLKKWQEEYQLPPVPVNSPTITLGTRDSDGDGLSDLEEGRVGTNPLKKDSDGDGVSDSNEVLQLHTNPLNPKDPPRMTKNGKAVVDTSKLGIRIISFVNDQLIADSKPVLLGIAKAGTQIEVVAIRNDKSILILGKTQTDENGIWILELEYMPDGEYTLKARKAVAAALNNLDLFAAVLGVTQENNETESLPVKVKINSSLDVAPPAPKKLADKFLGDDLLLKNVRVEIRDRKPTLLGRAAYGSEVLTTWRSLVMTSALIADTTAGEFAIQPNEEIDFGEHEVYIHAVRPKDGALSKTIKISFRVDKATLESQAVSPEQVKPVAESFADLKKSAQTSEGLKALMAQQNTILFTIIGVILAIMTLVGVALYVGHHRHREESSR